MIQSFNPAAKKKKKKTTDKTKKKPKAEPVDGLEKKDSLSSTQEEQKSSGTAYTYEFLLERITGYLLNKTKAGDAKRKIVLKPPEVSRMTGKRSVWVNFDETCNTLDRKPEHLMQFVGNELNTDASLNNELQLIMKGKVTNKQIESVLKRYINEYVTCSNCRHVNTTLYKNPRTRVYEMACKNCHSVKSVQLIKSAYHATGRGDRRREAANK
eukprot:TRINITY_DN6082_c0_g1_i2.p1 TRINITY_DN6082_c0_g1~~TRINITY_DN6082_c0_g1_i2.p1  ORF type:complete len:222 (-),score=48.24 TRINITY_DN6082_c0_g1_i2:55-690(-)